MSTQETYLKGIADALRGRGHSGEIQAKKFASKINQLPRLTAYAKEDPVWVGCYANQAVDVARSYWDARVAQKRSFVYDGGNGVFEGVLNDANGNGIIDCSTFIRLVLSGVDYLHSPYATGNLSDVAPRPDMYSWADTALAGNNVRYAADLAEYFFLTGRVLNGFDDLRPGDIIFHANGSIQNRFMGISHVSIVAEEGYDEVNYYNVTNVSNVVVRTRWSARNDYVFAARPNYEPARSYASLDESINLLTPPWYDLPTTKNGCTMTVSADGKSLEATGTPTNGTTFSLVSGSYPMYLRPGTYKLSGAPLRSDITSGYTWGLVVTDPDDATINYGWDLGNGAEFTLTETTPVKVYIYISSSKNPDGYVWTPKLTGKEN
jgi:hypothetical protein